MSNQISIGTFIKMKRKEKGYTLEQIGKYVGVSKGTVSRWESNEIGNMRTDRVKSLCEILEISTQEFLERSTTNGNKEIEQITPREFQQEVATLLSKTTNLSDQEKNVLMQTLNLICSDDK